MHSPNDDEQKLSNVSSPIRELLFELHEMLLAETGAVLLHDFSSSWVCVTTILLHCRLFPWEISERCTSEKRMKLYGIV